jgi:hypothetical protein
MLPGLPAQFMQATRQRSITTTTLTIRREDRLASHFSSSSFLDHQKIILRPFKIEKKSKSRKKIKSGKNNQK